MSKNKQKLWLFSMILIYVMVAIAGFVVVYMVKTYFLPQNPSDQTQVTAKVTSVPVPDGWKTYTDSIDKISFAYPSTDTVQTKSYGFGVSSLILQTRKSTTDVQILLLPSTLATAAGQDFDTYYAIQNNTTKTINSPVSQDNTTEKFTKIKNTTVDGNEAVDYQSIASNAKPGTMPEVGTFIIAGSNLMLFSTAQNNKDTLEKILSTFTSQ
jgi:hypothetical protein